MNIQRDLKEKIGNKYPSLADFLLNLRFLFKKDKSQFGETELMRQIPSESEKEVSYYLEIGSGHPVTYSNSWALSKSWSGIHVDPNESLSKLWRIFRPREIFLPYAITTDANNYELDYFKFPRRHSVLNSVVPQFSETWKVLGMSPKKLKVKAITIREILRAQRIDPEWLRLVMCDVEGFDRHVMSHMLDVELIHPQWILVEDFDSEIEILMNKRNYILIGTAGPTKLFKKAS